MTPLEYIALASAAMSLLESLAPKFRELRNSGEISPEQQKELDDKFQNLTKHPDSFFSGSEWTKSDGTPSRSQTGEPRQ